jgi:hypothetical protein
MTMATRFNPTGNPFFDGATLLSGGKLRFKQTGSDTLKDTYTSSSLASANTNPVVLDADGSHSDIWLDGVYKLEVLDSNDVEVREIDPIGGDASVTPFSAWSSTEDYSIGDIARGSNGSYYMSITNSNTGNDPTSSATDWTQLDIYKVWNTNETYAAGSIVKGSDNQLWVSQISNAGNDPTTDDGTNWQRLNTETRWAIISGTSIVAGEGFASVTNGSTGRFDITLSDAVGNATEVACFATVNNSGGGFFATADMSSTTVCRVDIQDDAGNATNTQFAVWIKERGK